MTTKKSAKTKNAKFSLLSKFSSLQAVILISVFALVGSITLYVTRASTLTWNQLAANYNCQIYYGVPPTMAPGEVRGCAAMLKYILRYDVPGYSYITDTSTTYGPTAVNAIKTIQAYFHINPADGVVRPDTWVLLQNFFYIKNPPSAPTVTQLGGKPVFSQGMGKLSVSEQSYFNSQYSKWGAIGQCIVKRESGGNYSINTGNGFYGAFQFAHNTWTGGGADYRGYYNAHQAPADIQWFHFFQTWADGAGKGHWPNTSKACY